MIYISEIRCKLSSDNWSFKNCLLCEHFTGQKVKKGWTCSAIWQTELCILAGTMTLDNRLPVHIRPAE